MEASHNQHGPANSQATSGLSVRSLTKIESSLDNCLICMGDEETESISSVRHTLPYALECNMGYFAAVMQELSRLLPNFDQYTFVFTRDVGELPRKFNDTPLLVALVMGDEWARVPKYAGNVHAVFKAPGQHIKLAMHKSWPRFNAMAVLQYLRLQSKRFPQFDSPKRNIFAIPYGYYRLPEVDRVTPIMQRSIDASFTGSLDHRSNGSLLRKILKTNKVLSRERLVHTVDEWKQDKPYHVDVKLSTSFPRANDKPQFNEYPQILMDTKICLSPRGTHLETYRVCEGMYYGCVVIAEDQPDHWFAEDSPAIILRDWRELPDQLSELLGDPAMLEQKQRESMEYWDRTLAPMPIAKYMQARLQETAQREGLLSGDAANDSHDLKKAA